MKDQRKEDEFLVIGKRVENESVKGEGMLHASLEKVEVWVCVVFLGDLLLQSPGP